MQQRHLSGGEVTPVIAALDDGRWPAASGLIDEFCGAKGNTLVTGEGGGTGGCQHLLRPVFLMQPPKAEREREYDMPGASMKTVRRAFFRPINVRREG